MREVEKNRDVGEPVVSKDLVTTGFALVFPNLFNLAQYLAIQKAKYIRKQELEGTFSPDKPTELDHEMLEQFGVTREYLAFVMLVDLLSLCLVALPTVLELINRSPGDKPSQAWLIATALMVLNHLLFVPHVPEIVNTLFSDSGRE